MIRSLWFSMLAGAIAFSGTVPLEARDPSLKVPETFDTIIRGARVLDGSGNPWFRADIAIQGERIAAVGDLKDARAAVEIDARELYAAPGFIDAHTHGADGLVTTPERREARPMLAQGVTTAIVNPDGGGPIDLKAQQAAFRKGGIGVNAAQLIGHGSVRSAVMGGAARIATDAEIEKMKALVRRGMEAGAFGLSSGPFYTPGCYSDTRELVECARAASPFGGVYQSHIRDESDYSIGLIGSVEELITVAREARMPAVVTHIKALGVNVWGTSTAVIRRIERARAEGLEIYADQYPYPASSTGLEAALIPAWARAGGKKAFLARLDDPTTGTRLKQEITANLARRGGAASILIARCGADHALEGKYLSDIAAGAKKEPVEAALDIIGKGGASIVSFNMNEADVRAFMTQPWTMTCSDGELPQWGSGVPHPRSFGAFARKIGFYARDERVLDLAAAVRSMTSLPAQIYKLKDRGEIRAGACADLAIFRWEAVRDKATFSEPYQLAEGMEYVFVNGKAAVKKGKFAGEMNGKVLLRGE